MFPSGFMPGAASLLCERDGRRIVYAGPIGPGPVDVRAADALCLDATFGDEAFAFPTRDQALAEVGRAVRDVLARGDAPVVLVDPVAIAVDIGAALAADRIGLAAHRSIVQAAVAYRHAGLTGAAAAALRGQAGPGRGAAVARAGARTGAPGGSARTGAHPGLRRRRFGGACPDIEGSARVTFPTAADFAGLIRYVEASGATEVALVNAPGDDAGGRAARPRSRRLHAGTAAPDRAFRRLS